MNSLRHARSRPRVHSVNFRSFEWVLIREVFVAVVGQSRSSYGTEHALRLWLCGLPSGRVHDLVERVLTRHPEWSQQ